MTMTEKARLVLRITTADFDDEINDLIAAARADLGIVGITNSTDDADPLITRAIMLYVKANFGDGDNYDRYNAAYESLRSTLRSSTGYTDWGH